MTQTKLVEPREYRQIVYTALITALCLLGDSMLYISLPLYWEDVGINALWQVGLLLSINRLVRLPVHPVIGWLYTKIRFRTGLVLACFFTAVSTLGYGLFQGFWAWLVLRSLWGMAWSFLILGGYISVFRYGKENHRGYLMGTFNGIYRLGSLGGMFAGGVLTSIIGLRLVALIFGSLSLAGIPFLYVFVRDNPPAEKPSGESARWWQGFQRADRALLIFASGFIVAMLVRGLLSSTLSLVIGRNYGETVLLFTIPIGAAAVSGTIQAVRWSAGSYLAAQIGRFSDGSISRIPVYVTFLGISAAGFLLVPFKLPLGAWLAGVLMLMLSVTTLSTLSDSLASDVAQSSRSVHKLTLYAVIVDLGAAVGPVFAYLTIMLKNGIVLAYAGAAFLLVCLALLWRIRGERE